MVWAAVAGQHAHNTSSGVASFTVTLPGNATIGNSIVLEINSGVSTQSPTTSVSGVCATWTEEVFDTYNDSGFNSRLSKYYGVVTSAATVITISINNNANTGFGAASAQEYSGLLGGGASDMDVGLATHGTSGGTPTVTTVGSTTAANELVSGGFTDDGSNVTPTGKPGAGFTERDSTGASTVSEAYLEDKDSGASGSTQTANMLQSIGSFWGMTCAVFKISAGGGGGGNPAPLLAQRRVRGIG